MTKQWKSCQTAHPNISSRTAENDNPPTLNCIAAEIQFFSQLQDRLQAGEIISIDEVAQDYETIMSEHQMTNSLTCVGWKESIPKHIDNVEFTRPHSRAKPTMIHSTTVRKKKQLNKLHNRVKNMMYVLYSYAQNYYGEQLNNLINGNSMDLCQGFMKGPHMNLNS